MPCLCDGRQVRQNDVSKPYATWLSEASVAEVLAAKAVETVEKNCSLGVVPIVAEVLAAKAVETCTPPSVLLIQFCRRGTSRQGC